MANIKTKDELSEEIQMEIEETRKIINDAYNIEMECACRIALSNMYIALANLISTSDK